ncbi:hypothetical protein niasHT_007773 [Heterodera trifolii]|uniref:Fibronectin type-III domain-containing protein n=1 Tax=Heterodera trifolii TaxID=157864 RepID=A0ABD2LKX0_9BILA
MKNFPTRRFSFFAFLFFFPSQPFVAFELLPFMQIDNQFYLRLAQCQAKCAEKYGISDSIRSLDGNLRPFFNWSSPLVELCHVGCLDSDIPPVASQQQSPGTDQNPSSLAFRQGQLFFRQTAPGNPFLASASIASELQILRVRPLCSQRLSSPEGLLKSTPFSAVMAIDMAKEGGRRTEQPLRFVIQWRRKVRGTQISAETEEEEQQTKESKWITASIEFDRTFHVTGIRAGHFHQFSVQLVSPLGPVGPPVRSHWLNFDAIIEQFETDGPMGRVSLQFFARYNMDNGVAALVRWRRDGDGQNQSEGGKTQKAMLPSRLKRHYRYFRDSSQTPTQFERGTVTEHAAEGVHELRKVSEFRAMDGHDAPDERSLETNSEIAAIVFPTCRLQIEWANKSTKTVEEFELDSSDGFLLRHLAFNSEYSVRLLPLNSSSADHSSPPHWLSLHGTFLSMHCSQVYGSGSLECDPEPVRELKVVPSVENGTALISWERPEELGNILLYEVTVEAVPEVNPDEQCQVKPSARIVSAQSNSVLFSLPQNAICEFLVQVVVYDLLGRDASSQQRFSFIPLGVSLWSQPSPMEFLVHLDGSVLALLSVVVFVPVAAMVTLICTFSRQNTRRKAIRQKLPGGIEFGRKSAKGLEVEKRTKKQKQKGRGAGKSGEEEDEEQRRNAKPKQCNSPQSTLTTESSIIGGTSATMAPQGTENGQDIGRQMEKHGERSGGMAIWTDTIRSKTEPNGAIV